MRYLLLLPLLWILPAQANTESEPECQHAFVDWMLHQQQQFSDRQADQMARRQAERAIDMARQEFEKQASFCKTMQLVHDYQDEDPRFSPRTGEIHLFHTAS